MINNLGIVFYSNNNFLYIRLIQDINYDTGYVFYKNNGVGHQIKYNNDTGKYYLITASIGNAPKGMKIGRLPGKDKILNITKNLINPTDILKNKDIINYLDSVRTKYKIMENKMTKKELENLIETKIQKILNEDKEIKNIPINKKHKFSSDVNYMKMIGPYKVSLFGSDGAFYIWIKVYQNKVWSYRYNYNNIKDAIIQYNKIKNIDDIKNLSGAHTL